MDDQSFLEVLLDFSLELFELLETAPAAATILLLLGQG